MLLVNYLWRVYIPERHIAAAACRLIWNYTAILPCVEFCDGTEDYCELKIVRKFLLHDFITQAS